MMVSNETLPLAFIKHEIEGRVRLKIPQKKGDGGYFDLIAEIFADCRGITQLQLNPSAASILICHNRNITFNSIVEFAETKGLFRLTEKPEDYDHITLPNLPLVTLTSVSLNRFDESLLDVSHGRLDARSLLFLALIGLAIHQVTRGNIMAPAVSLLWYALDLLKQQNENRIDLENKTNAHDE